MSGNPGQQDDGGAEHDHRRVEPVEGPGLAELLVDAGLPAEGLADVVDGRERQDRRREERGVQEAEGEERRGVAPGEGLERAGGVGRAGDGDAVGEERRGAGDDDEERHDVGHDAADDDVPPRHPVPVLADALLDHARLQVELHPRRDRRADEGDEHPHVSGVEGNARRDDGVAQHGLPVRMRQVRRDRVHEVEDARHEKDALDQPVGPAHDEEPDPHRHDRDRDPLRHAEELHARRDARELGDRVAVVRGEQRQHQVEGQLDAEVLPDQVGQALARHGAHARRHLLHDDQRDRDRDQRPEQARAELRPRQRIGRDAAGVVVDVGGDDAGADHAEKQDDLPPADRPPLRGAAVRAAASSSMRAAALRSARRRP